jgi:hypothetical protein
LLSHLSELLAARALHGERFVLSKFCRGLRDRLMLTERLSDPQFYSLMTMALLIGFAGLIAVIVWPLDEKPVDRGGFR